MTTIATQPIPIRGAISDQNGIVTKPWVEYFRSLQLIATAGIYVVANPAITGGTHTKITYDEKGLVTAGEDATTTDIPEGLNLYYTNQRVIDYLAPKDGILQGLDDDVSAVVIGEGLGYISGTIFNDAGFDDLIGVVTSTGNNTGTNLHWPILDAGSSTLSPLTFTSGTVLTTPTAGVREYDGLFYLTNNTVLGREADMSAIQYLNSAYGPSTNNTYFYFFSATGASGNDIPLTTGIYYIEYELNFNVNTANTTATILFTRNNSSGSWRVSADATPLAGASGATATINGSRLSADCFAGSSSTVTLTTGTLTSGVSHRIFVRMICQATSSSDYMTCQMKASTAGTATITTLANSYWMCRRFRSVGNNY